MPDSVKFQCKISCSSICCGGATVLTFKEIGKLYKHFPITTGFRKIYPINSEHRAYLENIAIKYGVFYIIGDFIAGNRLKKRCRFLKDFLCSIHGDLKPLQCRVIPFSVTFPEKYQQIAVAEKRKSAFKFCKGFNDNAPVLWYEEFKDKDLKDNFYQLKEEIEKQKEILQEFLLSLKQSASFKQFIQAENGILEIPLNSEIIQELFSKGIIKDKKEFVDTQKKLFIKEIWTDGMKNSLFVDALSVLEGIKI